MLPIFKLVGHVADTVEHRLAASGSGADRCKCPTVLNCSLSAILSMRLSPRGGNPVAEARLKDLQLSSMISWAAEMMLGDTETERAGFPAQGTPSASKAP